MICDSVVEIVMSLIAVVFGSIRYLRSSFATEYDADMIMTDVNITIARICLLDMLLYFMAPNVADHLQAVLPFEPATHLPINPARCP